MLDNQFKKMLDKRVKQKLCYLWFPTSELICTYPVCPDCFVRMKLNERRREQTWSLRFRRFGFSHSVCSVSSIRDVWVNSYDIVCIFVFLKL